MITNYSSTVPLPIPSRKYMRALIYMHIFRKYAERRKKININNFCTRLRSIFSPTVPLPIPSRRFMRALIWYAYI